MLLSLLLLLLLLLLLGSTLLGRPGSFAVLAAARFCNSVLHLQCPGRTGQIAARENVHNQVATAAFLVARHGTVVAVLWTLGSAPDRRKTSRKRAQNPVASATSGRICRRPFAETFEVLHIQQGPSVHPKQAQQKAKRSTELLLLLAVSELQAEAGCILEEERATRIVQMRRWRRKNRRVAVEDFDNVVKGQFRGDSPMLQSQCPKRRPEKDEARSGSRLQHDAAALALHHHPDELLDRLAKSDCFDPELVNFLVCLEVLPVGAGAPSRGERRAGPSTILFLMGPWAGLRLLD